MGVSGSITPAGMATVFDTLVNECGMSQPGSVFVDAGSGIGRPLAHAIVSCPNLHAAYGIEFDETKVARAHNFVDRACSMAVERGLAQAPLINPTLLCEDLMDLHVLPPNTTHLYSFWEGMPDAVRSAIGHACASTVSLSGIALVQASRPVWNIAQFLCDTYGFPPIQYVRSHDVKMCGSGARFTAYVFRRVQS